MMEEDTGKLTEILVGIGRLEEKADATNNHLARLNGSVQTLYGRSDSNRAAIENVGKELLQHQINCPGLKTILEIDRKLASGDFHGSLEVREKLSAVEKAEAIKEGKEKTTKEWRDIILLPFVKWVLMGVGILVLLHAHDLLQK